MNTILAPQKKQALERTSSPFPVARKGNGFTSPAGEGSLLDSFLDPEPVQAKAESGFSGSASAVPYQSEMEQSFGGVDFGGVKAYPGDVQAKAACNSLGADAYAVGNQIAFRDAAPSRALVAHELTHVGQQMGMGPQYSKPGGSQGLQVAGEAQAEAVEAAVASGKSASSALGGGFAPESEKTQKKTVWAGGSVTRPDDVLYHVGKKYVIIPAIDVPLGTSGFFIRGAGSATLQAIGTVPKPGHSDQSTYTLGIRGLLSFPLSIRFGARFASVGATAAPQCLIEGSIGKNADGYFMKLRGILRTRIQLDIDMGPGLFSVAHVLGDLDVINWTAQTKGDSNPLSGEWEFSPQLQQAIDGAKEVLDEMKKKYDETVNWAADTAQAVYDAIPW